MNKEDSDADAQSEEFEGYTPTPRRLEQRSKFDTPGRMAVIQQAYDNCWVSARNKRERKEKQNSAKKKAKIKHNEKVLSVQKKRDEMELTSSSSKKERPQVKKRYNKYEPIEVPGQVKMTTFMSPSSQGTFTSRVSSSASHSHSQVSSSASRSCSVKSNKTKSTAASSVASGASVSCKQSSVPTLTVTTNRENRDNEAYEEDVEVEESSEVLKRKVVDTVRRNLEDTADFVIEDNGLPFISPVSFTSADGSTLRPSVLARCGGVCRACHRQWHLCCEAKYQMFSCSSGKFGRGWL